MVVRHGHPHAGCGDYYLSNFQDESSEICGLNSQCGVFVPTAVNHATVAGEQGDALLSRCMAHARLDAEFVHICVACCVKRQEVYGRRNPHVRWTRTAPSSSIAETPPPQNLTTTLVLDDDNMMIEGTLAVAVKTR